jgi:hypothetical protein
MTNLSEWMERPPRNRLAGWLVREIQKGVLKALPLYNPPQGRGGHCPDEYARGLLSGLVEGETDPWALERLKDDGRAFRSWAERGLLGAALGDQDPGLDHPPQFAV